MSDPPATEPPSHCADAVDALALRLVEGGAELVRMSIGRICAALSQAASACVAADHVAAVDLRRSLREETGLSDAMVEWALAQVGVSFESQAVEKLAATLPVAFGARPVPARLTALVLSSNVFTAGLRALSLPLLARSPVLVKTPQHGRVLVSAFLAELAAVDEAVAQHVGHVTFDRGSGPHSAALLRRADVIAAYGDDGTMAALAARAPVAARLLPHGHGVSVAYVPASALTTVGGRSDAARRLALDVAAYDQLGCLSPQWVLVQTDRPETLHEFALTLSAALDEVEVLLPRGSVPPQAAAAIVQWRGVAAARGQLLAKAQHACSIEPGPLRMGPGYRHVGVHGCRDLAEAGQLLQPFLAHLKAVGVAGDHALRTRLADALPAGLAPRLCALGAMQTPPLDAFFDGRPPFDGLLNFIQVS